MKAKERLGKCDQDCKFNHDKMCCFGLRHVGCYIETEGIEQKMEEMLATRMLVSKVSYGANPEDRQKGQEFLDRIESKQFNFIFKEHEYVLKDSARDQGECPHCGNKSIGHFWTPKDKGFIGKKIFSKNDYAYCFECPKCFKKFFYHKNEISSSI